METNMYANVMQFLNSGSTGLAEIYFNEDKNILNL